MILPDSLRGISALDSFYSYSKKEIRFRVFTQYRYMYVQICQKRTLSEQSLSLTSISYFYKFTSASY